MRSLYEINTDYLQALETAFVINEETGEVTMQDELLDRLAGEFGEKVENITCYIKDLKAYSEAIKTEIIALKKRLEANDKKVDRLEEYVIKALKMRDMKKYDSPRSKVQLRQSKSVGVIDEALIDSEYWKEKKTLELDKKLILEMLKKDKKIAGCELIIKDSVSIK